MLTPPTHLNGIFHFFFNPSLMIYVFPRYINYRLNLYRFHIVYCSLKLFKLFLLKKRPYDLCFPFNIYQLQIEYISTPYCALESIALLTIFAKEKIL